MHTTVILVTHNSSVVLPECLGALGGLGDVSVRVIDNASTDGSVDLARRAGLVVEALDRNTGFAHAANLGASLAPGPLLCFLNPDCILSPDALDAARAALATGCVACAVPDFEQQGGVVSGCQQGYSWRKIIADVAETNGRSPRLVRSLKAHPTFHDPSWSWPLGTCLFVTKDTFDRIGRFDERYFLYMEDVAFGWQLHRHGGTVIPLHVVLRHAGTQGSSMGWADRLKLLNQARVAFARRQYGLIVGAWAALLART